MKTLARFILILAVGQSLFAQSIQRQPSSLADTLAAIIDREGLAAAERQFTGLRDSKSAILPIEPGSFEPTYRRYLNSNQLTEAVAVRRWDTQLFPQSAKAYVSFADALVLVGDREGAILNLQKAMALSPDGANANANLQKIGHLPEQFEKYRAEQEFLRLFVQAMTAKNAGKSFDLGPFRQCVWQFAEHYPEDGVADHIVKNYLFAVEAVKSAELEIDLDHFAQSSSEKIRVVAENSRSRVGLIGSVIDFKFTAIDGREVDLAKLRGNVVLIDFWATWCVPCMREMPAVVAVYEKYRSFGFEVVGVSLDWPAVPGTRSNAAKTPAEVDDFAKKHKMAWPQYCDGFSYKSPIVKKYGVTVIPATLLVDKSGKIVSNKVVAGGSLEADVRRLLGLPPVSADGN